MKLAQRALLCSLLTFPFISYGQNSVGIGVANPNKNAVLELISPGNNQGVLIPKLTTAQRTASSFTNNLANKENGLLVFDSDQNKFYYWETSAWKEMGTASLTSGDGITIVNNTVSVIPQDLELTGSTLTITGNPAATPIDLTAFSGTDTDQQTLSYNGATGGLTISRLTGGPQSVTLTTAGTAGGDLTGTFPNPTVAANAITSTKILDGTIASADILDGTIAGIDITDGTVASIDIATGGVASVDILDQAIVAADIADNAVVANHILDGTIGTADIATGGVASVDILDGTVTGTDIADGSVASVDIVDGTIISADIADGTVATADILDNTITTNDINDGTIALADMANNSVNSAKIVDASISNADIADLNVGKLSVGTNGQVLTTSGGAALWANPSGTTLINNAGTNNLFAGQNVGGPGITPSSDNTFFGYSAGYVTSAGQYNVAVGSLAGVQNDVGNLNTFVGWAAGSGAGDAFFNGNTFLGARAGQVATRGPNTFIGERAGLGTTLGTESVMMGNGAGLTNTTGGRHTIIGYEANVSGTGLQNSVAIGYQAIADASNKIRLGNDAITVIQGFVGFTAASDRRLKTNIQPFKDGLDLIMKLKPVSYNMKNSSDLRTNWGFIAQDVEALVGESNAVLTVNNDKDRTLGLRYSDFVAPLVKAVQEQQDQISDLNNKLTESEKKYEALAAELEQIKKAIGLKVSKK